MSRTLRRLIPSPAMIVALLALVMSLGGSAYATLMNGDSSPPYVTSGDIVDHTVRGKDILAHSIRGHKFQKDSVGGRAIKEDALERFWAVVEEDGSLDRGKGLAEIANPTSLDSSLLYHVIFNRDVDDCSYQATIGSPGTAVPDEDSQITVSLDPDNDKGVLVRTATGPNELDGTNTEVAMPFQLAVSC